MKNLFNKELNWQKLAVVPFLTGMFAISGCQDDADVASYNLSKAADNFEVQRQIVFYNGITDEYIAVVEGRCSIEVDGRDNQLEVTCKVGENEFKKDFLGLSDNVTYFALQTETSNVSEYHHRVTFKPQTFIPNIDFRGDAGAVKDAILKPQP